MRPDELYCAVLCFVLHCPLVLTYSVAQVEHNSKLRRDHQGKALESTPLFPAIQLIHDPQALAERLFKKLRQPGEKFEVKLLLMNFISRLIGCHKLVLLSFYSFLQRYITSHQKDVTHILAYLIQVLSTSTNDPPHYFFTFTDSYPDASHVVWFHPSAAAATNCLATLCSREALLDFLPSPPLSDSHLHHLCPLFNRSQGCHDLVPPEDLMPVIKAIAYNFITGTFTALPLPLH